MNRDQFAFNAEFPVCWLEHGLLDGDFFVRQVSAFEAEHRESRPAGGTEHWRYGAFLHWLHQDCDSRLLGRLLDAALADPDPPMAGNVLRSIVAKPNCTKSIFDAALARVTADDGYYVSPSELQKAFESRHL